MKLTTHLNLLPGPRMLELCLHNTIRLHGVVLNKPRDFFYLFLKRASDRAKKTTHIYVSKNYFPQVAASETVFGPAVSMQDLRKPMAKHRKIIEVGLFIGTFSSGRSGTSRQS